MNINVGKQFEILIYITLEFLSLARMLVKALDFCAQSIKWDETSFNTTFDTKM